MKKFLLLALLAGCATAGNAEIKVTAHQEGWNNIPREAQRRGFAFQKSILVQMDDDPALEEVILFGHDNGHYPTFDLFKAYYAIVDNDTKEVQYITDGEYVTDHYDLTVEDRNNDGIYELYVTYFKDGQFSVDERGNNLQTVRCYDRIEFTPDTAKTKKK